MIKPSIHILGAGAVSQHFHAPALAALIREKKVQIGSIFDPLKENSDSLRRLVGGKVLLSEEQMIRTVAPNDFVLIASPPRFHARQAEEFIERGANVLIEKPATIKFEETLALLDRQENCPGSISIAQVRRVFPTVVKGKEIIKRFNRGKYSAYAADGGKWSWPAKTKYYLDPQNGGVLYDTGVHLIDSVIYLIGLEEGVDVSELIVDVRTKDSTSDHVISVNVIIKYRDTVELELIFSIGRTDSMVNLICISDGENKLVMPSGVGCLINVRSNLKELVGGNGLGNEIGQAAITIDKVDTDYCFYKMWAEVISSPRQNRFSISKVKVTQYVLGCIYSSIQSKSHD